MRKSQSSQVERAKPRVITCPLISPPSLMVDTLSGRLAEHVVIVVEDEPVVRLVAVVALEDAGFKVIGVAHSDEALSVLQARADSVQALFTDIHMPGTMSGLELAHHARAHWPWIAILIASGNLRPPADKLPNGSRFVAKPYELDNVVRHVHELTAA